MLSEATWNALTAHPAVHERLPEQLVKGRDTPVVSYKLPSADLTPTDDQPIGAPR